MAQEQSFYISMQTPRALYAGPRSAIRAYPKGYQAKISDSPFSLSWC